jgi:PKD domain-containing protein
MGKGGALLATLAACFAAATPARAAPGWATPPGSVSSTGSSAVSPDVAITPAGETVAVWWDANKIKAATRPQGGAFGAPVALSEDVADSPVDPGPRIVVHPSGRALVTWLENGVVRAAFRTPGGSFEAAKTLSGTGAGVPRAVFTSDGRAVVTWERGAIEAAVSAPGGDFPGMGRKIDGPGQGRPSPAVAADARGNAYLVWVINDQSLTGHLRVAVSPAGSAGFPAAGVELFSEPGSVYTAPAIAAAPDGAAGVTWLRLDPRALSAYPWLTYVGRVQAVAVGADLTHGPVQTLEVGVPASTTDPVMRGTYPSDTRMAADGKGNLAAVWTVADYDTAIVTVRRSVLPAGQTTFGSTSPAVISTKGADAPVHGSASVAALATGSGFLLGFSSASGLVRAALVRADGGFDAPATISGPEASSDAVPRIGVGPAGDALAIWSNTDGAVKLAVYDATPPELRDIRAPAAIAGQPVDFAVSPFDAWTPVTVAWHFGDDTPIVGGQLVSHAFARAGRFTMTVVAADALGNSSAETREIPVTAPDTTPPTIRSLSLTRKRFAVGARATALIAAAKRRARGTTIRYTISEAATVKVYLSRVVSGRRATRGGSCSTRARSGRRCTRFRMEGALTRQAPAGARRLGFSGRLGRKALRPGRYRVTVVAIDAAGNRSRSRSTRFTLVRR